MTDPTAPNLYALLIGVDCYLPNKLPDGSFYKNLGGCVRDINHVEAFLKQWRQVPDSQIWKLTASPSPTNPQQPIEPPDQWPTRQNIIERIRTLTETLPEGAQVYIQYSGHGGRAKTVYPEIKGEDGIDEGLVPTDIGSSEGQYLRDLELAQLLKELVAKKLMVTLVLDCCHSGGATRGDAEIRGMSVIDDKPLSASFVPVAPLEVLTANWQDLSQQNTRGLKVAGLPESRDYVLLAACRQNEFAYEYAFNRQTKERNGALTYWLLDTLKQNPGQTYSHLFDRVYAKIHSQFPQQTPMLMGEGNRLILGSELAETVYAVPVLKVESSEAGTQAVLAVGQPNGVGKGTEFAIYPRSTTDFSNKENRIAIAKIIERGADQSVCQLEPIPGKELQVEPGDQAVQIAASVNLVRQVWLCRQEALSPEILAQQEKALEAIKSAATGNGWIELVDNADENEEIDYIVVVNNSSEYEICDPAGAPLKNITPALKISDPNAPAILVKRLVHLAKHRTAAEIDNTDIDSPLAGKLTVEWLGTSDAYELGDPIPKKLSAFADPSNPTVKVGEYIFLAIRNDSVQPLNIAALNFESNWAIAQIFPHDPGAMFVTLDPGKKHVIPLRPAIEDQSNQVENTVKVFATVGAANFRWLELPSLDQQIPPKAAGTRSGSPLDALLATVAEDQPKFRKLTVAASPSREWTTKQVPLTIVK
ncbi:caspase family protein [Leptolyngbya sp. NK1-12]|uniref:Caspase family protein n=1 Tax=Leptolyngbya sp. NK1-12 TaxID=2547451 RepID=A0AA96WNZ6_9CYAN|nr:caspase family protein [Leptolyngbya sp. NK1-12]WNZ26226.1 caspase family protein [Leptolyngbya sp. NK1-12]